MSFESLTPKSPSPEPEKPPQKPNEQKLTIANDGSGIVNVNINMLGNESKPPRKRTPKITNPDDPDKPPKKSSPKTTPKPEPQPSQSLDTTTPDTVNPQQKQGLDTTTPDTANLQQKQSISLLGGALKFVTMMVGDESDKTKNLLSHLEAEGILSDIPLDLPEMLNNASKDDVSNCLTNFSELLNKKIKDAESSLEQSKEENPDNQKQAIEKLKENLTKIKTFLDDYQNIKKDQEKFNQLTALINSLPENLLDAMPSKEKSKLAKVILSLLVEIYKQDQEQNKNDTTSQAAPTDTPPNAPTNAVTGILAPGAGTPLSAPNVSTPAANASLEKSAPVKNKINIKDILAASGMGLAWAGLFAVVLLFLLNFKLVEFAVENKFK